MKNILSSLYIKTTQGNMKIICTIHEWEKWECNAFIDSDLLYRGALYRQ
jgi:hypothetical protein